MHLVTIMAALKRRMDECNILKALLRVMKEEERERVDEDRSASKDALVRETCDKYCGREETGPMVMMSWEEKLGRPCLI